MNKPTLYYIHDPMCSWCWGFANTLYTLLEQLPQELEVRRLLGGLAPDSNTPMPTNMQETIKGNWRRIEEKIAGVRFNFDFWTKSIPRRSTYPACRAVIAARFQGEEYDLLMTKAIQWAYYKEARNPSDNSTLIELAKEIGLSESQFKQDLKSKKLEDIFNEEMSLVREFFIESFPSLVLVIEDDQFSIRIDYNDYRRMLEQITQHL